MTPRAPPAARGPWTLEPAAPGAPAPPADLRQALRRGAAGCANPALLSPEEREACEERLGAGAKDAPFFQPPMDPRKRQAFDEAAAKKEAYQRYKRGNVPPSTMTPLVTDLSDTDMRDIAMYYASLPHNPPTPPAAPALKLDAAPVSRIQSRASLSLPVTSYFQETAPVVADSVTVLTPRM